MSSNVTEGQSTIKSLQQKTNDLQSTIDQDIKDIYILLIILSTVAIAIVIFLTVKFIRKKTY